MLPSSLHFPASICWLLSLSRRLWGTWSSLSWTSLLNVQSVLSLLTQSLITLLSLAGHRCCPRSYHHGTAPVIHNHYNHLGLDKTFSVLRHSFYLFSAASWKVYNALLKLVRWALFLPSSDIYVRSFLYPFTLNKNLCCTKLWVSETASLVLELNLLLWRPQIWHQTP